MSEPVDVNYLFTIQPAKDPYRSHGVSDLIRGFGPTEDIGNGKMVVVRKMTYFEGLFIVEAVYGAHAGQAVAIPAANVQWARVRDSRAKSPAAPGNAGKKVA